MENSLYKFHFVLFIRKQPDSTTTQLPGNHQNCASWQTERCSTLLWITVLVEILFSNQQNILFNLINTGCVRQNENPTNFKILKEPLLEQKKTLHQQKALDLCYLEPEGQGRGSIMGVPRPLAAKSIFSARRVFESLSSMTSPRPHDKATPLSFWLQIAEIKSFLLM